MDVLQQTRFAGHRLHLPDRAKPGPASRSTTCSRNTSRSAARTSSWKRSIRPTTSPAPPSCKSGSTSTATITWSFSNTRAARRFVKQEDLFEINPMTGQVGAFKGEQQFTAAHRRPGRGQALQGLLHRGPRRTLHPGRRLRRRATAPSAQSLKNENVETDNLNLAAKGRSAGRCRRRGHRRALRCVLPDRSRRRSTSISRNNGKLFVLLDPYVTLGLDDLLKKYGLQIRRRPRPLPRGMTTTGAQVTVPLAADLPGRLLHPPDHRQVRPGQPPASDHRTPARSPCRPTTRTSQPKTQFLLQTDADAWGWVSKNGAHAGRSASNSPSTRPPTSPGPLTIAAVYDGGTTTDPDDQGHDVRPRASSPSAPPNSWRTTPAEPVGREFLHATASTGW